MFRNGESDISCLMLGHTEGRYFSGTSLRPFESEEYKGFAHVCLLFFPAFLGRGVGSSMVRRRVKTIFPGI